MQKQESQSELDQIPIIVVHRFGWPICLLWTLVQARRVNSANPIIAVADPPFAPMEGIVEIVDYSATQQTGRELRDIYFHYSPNPPACELTCIERWFVIRDLMKQRKFSRCLCIDSDVLLFNSLANFWPRYANRDFSYICGPSWGSVIINDRRVLDAFCDMVLKVFNRDPEVWPGYAEHIGFSTPYKKLLMISDM